MLLTLLHAIHGHSFRTTEHDECARKELGAQALGVDYGRCIYSCLHCDLCWVPIHNGSETLNWKAGIHTIGHESRAVQQFPRSDRRPAAGKSSADPAPSPRRFGARIAGWKRGGELQGIA